MSTLDALRALYQVCVGMDLDNQEERPTEEEYQQVMAEAKRAIDAQGGAA